jgi:hypothetical protein
MSLKNGVTDAKTLKEFRTKNDARIEQTVGDRSRRRQQSVPEHIAFGKPNRPSTPINGIISNYYGETAQNEIVEKYNLSYEIKKNVKGMPKPKETKAHEKAVEYTKMKQTTTAEDKPAFKLKRFQNVEARVTTNRATATAIPK